MDLKTFWKSLKRKEQEALAKRAGTSYGYLYLIFMGHKRPGAELAKSIAEAGTALGVDIPRSALRPDLWDAA